jgi:hypothetical protein
MAKAAKKDAEKPTTETKSTRSTLDKTQTIEIQEDKEGNAYGKKNNPKRKGSKSAERFEKYRDGMTVESALKAGLVAGDIHNDTAKGYIKLAA